MSDKTDYEKYNKRMREKEERRLNYAKYVKEINLPLELDRKSLHHEASKMRLNRDQQDSRLTVMNKNASADSLKDSYIQNQKQYISNISLHRQTAQASKRGNNNNLPPINRNIINQSPSI